MFIPFSPRHSGFITVLARDARPGGLRRRRALDRPRGAFTLQVMNTLMSLSPSTLRKAAKLQEKILELQVKLGQILGDFAPTITVEAPEMGPKAKKRRLSAAGLAAIRAGVRKRMAHHDGRAGNGSPEPKPKKKMSAAGRAAISAAAKARWKKAKAAGRSHL
jgi:hypothetical protein